MYELSGRKVLVVGLARSGVAAAKLCVREGARVTVTDKRKAADLEKQVAELAPLGVRFELGGHDVASFTGADLVVCSPGVPLANSEFVEARKAGFATFSTTVDVTAGAPATLNVSLLRDESHDEEGSR